jgi:GNAT superfamily N-acetyltransferase
MDITLDVASTDQHFEQILRLQTQNLFSEISEAEQAQQGFVFAQHSVPLLKRMAAQLPQVIAVSENKVVGYNLAMPVSMKNAMSRLAPMFAQFERTQYRGRPLATYNFMVGGQVCVDKDFRGQGLLRRLYRETRNRLPPGYELCVTEIAARNVVSLEAHLRMGFEEASTYHDGKELWIVVVWDLTRPSHRGIRSRTASYTGGARIRLAVLLTVTAVAAAVVLRMDPIPQDPTYHRFADTRPWLGIPNFQNVASNLPFLVVGLLGLARLQRRLAELDGLIDVREKAAWLLLFAGVTLTAFGSAYYHLAPSNVTLVWDRLPMTLGFMGFFAGVIGERVSQKAYRLLLWPLVGLGVASVLVWYAGEARGAGDLRLYGLVQFSPLLLIPLIMALYRPRYSHGSLIFGALGCYAAAKLFELWDRQIYDATSSLVGGHALKHLAAAAGCWVLLRMFSLRTRR